MRRSLPALLLGTLLLGGTSCRKDGPEAEEGLSYVNGLPYYHFTSQDQPWLQAKTGDSWTFENGRGVRHTYAIQVGQYPQRAYETFAPYGLLGTKYTVVSYYDETVLSAFSPDTSGTGSGGNFHFYRDATVRPYNEVGTGPSRLYAEGYWGKFVGNTDLHSDYYSCRGVKFPSGTALNGPFQQLTVRGRTYTDVVAFIGTSRGPNCQPVSSAYLQEMYYDRQAGLVRLVSLGGEVWDRVP
ncbi:hypothetical protein [Hymenobacter convexus]|uniref:hypothetical protein n=1 Tax=Hymenobacter sp. CA1UV-4 TaxID=3063782 RepID=UPI0027132FB1|nr:hypothetical protein [Hymenobacter sp. CA1UV-4]MDO7853362.1 hypothetical protein [Hymenobacter sp. CA1UV-4]